MSQSPSQFDVSTVNGAHRRDCWRHHSSSLVCVRSVSCLGFCRSYSQRSYLATLIIAALYGMAWPNSLVRNFKNFKIVLSELSPNLAMILVPDFFLSRLVGTIYRWEGLNKRLIQCTSALMISLQLISVNFLSQGHRITIFATQGKNWKNLKTKNWLPEA